MKLKFETAGVNISYNSKGKETIEEIATPIHICRDMSELFDYTDCNQKIWMDIYCKTGNTIQALKENGVNKNNIAAICDNKQSQMLVCRKLYGKILPEVEVEITIKSLEAYKVTRRGQVYWISSWQDTVRYHYQDAYNIIKFVILKEMEKTMSLEFTQQDDFQINNIIMNPPYNPNDLYIDFSLLAKQIASENIVAITPTKGISAKGGEKSEDFRKNIVPYIENIVVYPDCTDVFAIAEPSGVAYYMIGKDRQTNIHIENKCKLQKIYNDTATRSINSRETLINKGNIINDKLKEFAKFSLSKTDKQGRYQVWLNNKLAIGGGKAQGTYLFSNDGMFQCLSLSRIVDKNGNTSDVIADSQLVFSSDNMYECESFVSWIQTRFVRYLISINLAGLTGVANPNNDWWRFVPDPGAFDHIFTDKELYEKYDLTEEEIAIIESVIKERK